jgi:uncharacterized protein DUF4262
MEWWPLDSENTPDDKIGDAPANVLKEALEMIALARSARGKGALLLPEVLDMLVLALSVLGADLYTHHRREQVAQLTAEVVPDGQGAAISVGSEPSGTYSEQDALALMFALKVVAGTYQEAWDRLPRLRELLALFSAALTSSSVSLAKDDPGAFTVSCITPVIRRKPRLRAWWEEGCSLAKRLTHRCLRARRSGASLSASQRSLRQLQLESQISAAVQADGFFIMGVFDPRGDKPAWAYTIGLHHTNPALADVIVIGLSVSQLEQILRVAADNLLRGVIFEAGRVYTDLTEGDYPCFFGAVDPSSYDAYVGQGINYYAGQPFPLLQLVWPDSQKLFPWQSGFEEKFRAQQPLLFDPAQYPSL